MTTPNSHFHPHHHQLLLLLLLLHVILVIFAGAAEEQPLMARPGCIDKCGNIVIPFPFGIGPGCFRKGFEVLCNHSRAFLADNSTRIEETGLGFFDGSNSPGYVYSSPVELVSISVAMGEARAYAPVSYVCINSTAKSSNNLTIASIFAVSMARNVLIAIGEGAEAELSYDALAPSVYCRSGGSFYDGTYGSCTWHDPAIIGSSHFVIFSVHNTGSPLSPGDVTVVDHCSYGMLVEKSWYNFSTEDMYGSKTLLKKFPRGVPVVLDFTAGNTSCPAEGQPPPPGYACISANSYCANTTSHTVADGGRDGYICKCLKHYDGNPYLPNGCQDIDECKQPQLYPCSHSGICINRLGGYDCPCKFGMKGDAKAGTCTDIFPTALKASVGTSFGILLVTMITFFVLLRQEKKKTKKMLLWANVIKLFKKRDLKPILKNRNLIGKGCFGEVYMGLLQNELVAVKKPISGSVIESEQFANEVIIHSQIIHKNIVRLIGCCLEVDAPMLVYEFISHGSLHDILHNNKNNVALNLDARLNIATQSADGLAYMHSKANIRILHGDVKPANILLHDNFVPKISDFGISRLIARDKEHIGSVIGDINYMDPLYLQEGLLTEKNDVYSFGIVILELISRRRSIHSEDNTLVNSFLEAHKKQNKFTELFDKEIAITKDLEHLDSLAGMAVECLSLDVDQRPTMMEVAERLLILSRSRKMKDICH